MGFDTDNVLHHGTPSQNPILEMRPSSGENHAMGDGVYMTPDQRLADLYSRGGTRMDLMVRGPLRDYFQAGQRMRELSAEGHSWEDAMSLARQESKDGGYSGYQFANEVAVWDPRNIRSVNAAFDPAKADSANLLAANPKTAGAVPLAASGRDEDPFLNSMLQRYGGY